MKPNVLRRLAAVLLIFALVLSACGPAAPAAPSATAAPTQEASSAASDTTEAPSAESTAQTTETPTEQPSSGPAQTPSSETPAESAAPAPTAEPVTEPGTDTVEEEISLDAVFAAPVGGLAVPELLDTGKEVAPEEIERIERVMRAYTAPNRPVMVNNADTFYYYEQLSDYGQRLYDALYLAASDPSGDNYVLFSTPDVPSTPQFKQDVNCVFWCMLCDHPELYWLYITRTISWNYSGGSRRNNYNWNVYFCVDEQPDFKQSETRFAKAAQEFLRGIDTSGSQKQTARQIHDKLIHLVRYDYDLADRGGWRDIGHTAYGALVENARGQANTCVCDGYSAAYLYLLQQCGITAAMVLGSAGNDFDSMGGHAWNIAYLDGRWYEIDATWDDFGLMDEPGMSQNPHADLYREAAADPATTEAMEHWLFMVTTADIYDFYREPVVYHTKNGRYRLTFYREGVHVRDCDLEDSWYPWEFVTSLLPVAE